MIGLRRLANLATIQSATKVKKYNGVTVTWNSQSPNKWVSLRSVSYNTNIQKAVYAFNKREATVTHIIEMRNESNITIDLANTRFLIDGRVYYPIDSPISQSKSPIPNWLKIFVEDLTGKVEPSL